MQINSETISTEDYSVGFLTIHSNAINYSESRDYINGNRNLLESQSIQWSTDRIWWSVNGALFEHACSSLKGRDATGGHFSGLLFNLRLSIFSWWCRVNEIDATTLVVHQISSGKRWFSELVIFKIIGVASTARATSSRACVPLSQCPPWDSRNVRRVI